MNPRTDDTRFRTVTRLMAALLLVTLVTAGAGVVVGIWETPGTSDVTGSETPRADGNATARTTAATEPEAVEPTEPIETTELTETTETTTIEGATSEERDGERTRSSYTVRSGTRNATEVYVIESESPGPTALVVGGLHGDEHSGHRAARDVADWEIAAGTLVVIPAANRPALDRDSRKAFGSDVNDEFPVGDEPNTTLARAIWGVVERHDPDLVVDLHSSSGIYGMHDGRVGQAVFPTVTGSAVADADAAVGYMNREHVPESKPNHSFERGNVLTGHGHSLIRKVAGDRNETGLIVETTEYETTLDTRVRWTKAIVGKVLERHGIIRKPGIESNRSAANERRDIPSTDSVSFEMLRRNRS